MLRSMYAGISGMKNFQTKLDVIGNNIANVNTYGFKKGRVTFKDLVNQQLAGAVAATDVRSGVNLQQVGLGSQIASVDTIHTTGATQTTNRTLDLALGGDGFFPVATIKDPTKISMDQGNRMGNNRIQGAINNAVDLNYTRSGNFYLDDRGYLVTSEGMFIVGETGEKTLPTGNEVTKSNNALNAITSFNKPYEQITASLKGIIKQAKDLQNAYQEYDEAYKNYQDNGPRTTGGTLIASGPLWDAMGSAQAKLATVQGLFNTTRASFNTAVGTFNTNLTNLNTGITAFNTAAPVGDIFQTIARPLTTLAAGSYPTNTDIPANNNPVQNTVFGQMTKLVTNLEGFAVNLDQVGRAVVNFENAAEYVQQPKWTDSLSGQAGLIQIPLTAKSFSVAPNGTVTFVNEKGDLNIAGQIRVANFANAGGLEKVGGNLFRESMNSGTIDQNNNGVQLDEFSVAGQDGAASVIAGSLEMSNVDLSEEFTEMIVAQRGFQSNTKIITTSDEILQELVNLKR